MINLDDLRDGDKVTVEATVTIDPDDPGTIRMSKRGDLRFWTYTENEDFKVLSHTPKPIEEPKGLGAVVEIAFPDNMSPTFRIVNAGTPDAPWRMNGYHNVHGTWDSFVGESGSYRVVKVIHPGV